MNWTIITHKFYFYFDPLYMAFSSLAGHVLERTGNFLEAFSLVRRTMTCQRDQSEARILFDRCCFRAYQIKLGICISVCRRFLWVLSRDNILLPPIYNKRFKFVNKSYMRIKGKIIQETNLNPLMSMFISIERSSLGLQIDFELLEPRENQTKLAR